MPRTETLDFDVDFDVAGEVTKSEVLPDGSRMIRGVASGIKEDLQGERVSAKAIRKMASQPTSGGAIKLVGAGHDQDWMGEIGDVTNVTHDVEHDELLVKCILPPEGEDPIADKAWTVMHKHGQKMGFSIGGKLRKAFYEQTDTGKRRKVLDDIHLRHVLLTKKPAYRDSFAEAVAKSMPDAPDDGYTVDDEVEDYTQVAKDVSAADQTSSSGAGDRNAGVKPANAKGLDVNGDDDKKDDDDQDDTSVDDLPRARHLACPNCGHEFAADLPAEGAQDTKDTPDGKSDTDDAAKTAEEPIMLKSLDESLTALKTLTGDPADTAKTADDADVVKTDDDRFDSVEKMLAASHRVNSNAIEELGDSQDKIVEAVQAIGKSLSQVVARLNSGGTGRKSIARTGDGTDDPEAGATPRGEVDDEDSPRHIAKEIEDAESAVDVIKTINRTTRGIS